MVLDDDAGRGGRVEQGGHRSGSLGVQPVVERHLLALQDLGPTQGAGVVLGCVQGAPLVGVLSVPKAGRTPEDELDLGWELVLGRLATARRFEGRHCAVALAGEPIRDRLVVRGGVGEGRPSQPQAGLPRQPAQPAHLLQDRLVLRGVRDHPDGLEVLRRGPDQGGAADVDLLDAVVERGPPGHGGPERIQVHHHQVEGLDAVRLQLRQVLGLALVGQDPAVDARMERFDPAF